MKNFFTVEKETANEIMVKKSRFICSLRPVLSLEEGTDFVKKIKNTYNDATHHCYSILGLPESNEEKSSDDGEPAGTGGAPIKNILLQNQLQGISCVVTRYYGGIKLGSSGLGSSYAKSVIECLSKALKVEMLWSEIIILTLSYGDALEISKRMEKEKILLLSSEYLDKVKLKFGVPTEKKDVFYNIIEGITSGKFFSEIDKSQYIGYRREIT